MVLLPSAGANRRSDADRRQPSDLQAFESEAGRKVRAETGDVPAELRRWTRASLAGGFSNQRKIGCGSVLPPGRDQVRMVGGRAPEDATGSASDQKTPEDG